MTHPIAPGSPAEAMRRINAAWLGGNVEDLAALVDSDVVMAIPGFAGRIHGRQAFLAGFVDFCEHAKIQEFHEQDQETDLVGDVAVVTFRFAMIYERGGERCRATGRDFWVFRKADNLWIAIWRTMFEMQEEPTP